MHGLQAPPVVTAVSIASPAVGDTFERGETIEIAVTFSKAVDVTGAPRLALTIGSTTRQAAYASGTGSTSLVFRYVVVSGDADADGVSIGASALALNGGTIKEAGGTLDARLGLGAHAVSDSAGHKVAGGTFTAPSVNGVTITSEPSIDSTYVWGDTIEVEVTFTRPVAVVTSMPGVRRVWPLLSLGYYRASYASGTGTKALTFRYTVRPWDRDASGISIGAGAVWLGGGAINDARDDTTAASLSLAGHTILRDKAHKVDGSLGPPGPTGLSVARPVGGDTFERGDTIEVELGFHRAVDVTGTPRLALTIGAATRQADYASGTGSTSLVFRYLVVQADADADGFSIGASALALNGGTIKEAGGTLDARLGLGASAISNSYKVAGGTFTASSVNGVTITSGPASSDRTYVLGDTIEVKVWFTRPVAVTGGPQLALGIASGARRAAYASGTGTNALTFRYTVTARDADTTGLSIGASALVLNGGEINDARPPARTAASLGLGTKAISNAARHKVDGSRGPPGVTGLSVPQPPTGDTFEGGDTIVARVWFNKAVDVTGTPQLALTIGSTTRQASYASGTGSGSLGFRYVVVSGDADADGISIGASALALNGGTIKEAGGTLDARLDLGAYAYSNITSRKVAGGTITASSVIGVRISSVPFNTTYALSQRIEVKVTFTRAVAVTGEPQLALTIGGSARPAAYASGTGTNALTFRYTVQATDRDLDGLSIGASALALNGGAINDVRDGATAASLDLGTNAISNAGAHKVDGSREPPVVTAVSIASPVVGDTFERGETIEVAVTFSKAVDVIGRPELRLIIGTGSWSNRFASYASGTGSTTLVFRYVVVLGDADADGISINENALDGSIREAGGRGSTALKGLSTYTISNSAGHKVAGGTFTASSVSGVTITSEPSIDSTYVLGDTIEVEVTFTRPVTVTGGPQLTLTIGVTTRRAAYASGTGTNALTFRYTVTATDADTAGLSIGASALVLNGGKINDARPPARTAASLGLGTNAISNAVAHKVDGSRVPRVVSAVSVSSPVVGNTFERGDTIGVTVTFNKAVDVTGGPRLALTIGSTTKQAAYASGTGSTSLVFKYRVVMADADADGISIGASALALNGGTIKEAGGTLDAALRLGAHAVSNSPFHKVAGGTITASSVSGVTITSSPASDSTYVLGERIEVEVTFTRPVAVTGGPQLVLGIAHRARPAAYASGTGTNALTFRYTVTATDADTAGLSIGASALALNGGAVADARDGATAASLGLGTNAISNAAAHKVDGSLGPAGVTQLSVARPVVGDTFERGDTIVATVWFNKAVDVTGGPQLALGIGAATKQAAYASGTGSRSLVFRYLVVQADVDADGITIGAGALTLNGGTIDVAGGTTDALLGLGARAISNDPRFKVAGGTFTASSVSGVTITSSPASDSTYYVLGERIEVEVTFTRPVAVTGGPQLVLGIASGERPAAYASGTGTNALTFRYTVTATDADTAGLSIGASALALNGGAIDDARDGATAASLGLGTNAISNAAAHKVDGSRGPPGVSGLSISSPVVGDTFERGETIEVKVTFNKAVFVTGTPQLALTIGAATKQAAYASGTGSRSLVFRYLVVQADVDADGISIGAGALALNGGTIYVRGGTTDALLGLGAHAVSNSAGHKVAGGTFTASLVSGVTITSSPASDSTYVVGDRIEVEVTFTRPVAVTGGPQLALGIASGARRAAYASGTGTNALTFQYTVQVADVDTLGISIGASALALNGGAIDDARGGATAASLGLGTNAISNAAAHKVDGSRGPPGVSGLSIASPVVGDTFERGETIEVTVTFNKAVDVTGRPRLALTIGSATKQAVFYWRTDSTSLVFRYRVVMADADADGISIGASALALNGGTIKEAGGTLDAALGLGAHAVSNSAGHKVAGGTFTAPVANGMTITSSPASDSTYVLGERIEVEVTFTRPVRVTGVPQLVLGIASGVRRAAYASGTGTKALMFRYTVQATDRDLDGLSIAGSRLSLSLWLGAINDWRDGTTAASREGANGIGDAAAHKVNGGVPVVSGLSISSPVVGDTFERGETIGVTVTFNKAVDVTGGPRLALTIGSTTKQAVYASGTGSTSLVFRHLVVMADADADGISIGASALALNGGTIKEAGGTLDAALRLGAHAVSNSPRFKVAGGTFTTSSVSGVTITSIPTSDSTYVLGERIEVEVTFTRPVAVTGEPQLALGIASGARRAAYASGTGTNALTFRYTVTATDADTAGLSIGASALALNGGAIDDARGGATAASLGLGTNAISNAAAHKVDGSLSVPFVSGLSISSPVVGDTFERGDTIEVTVTFNKAVDVTGTPQLALTVGHRRAADPATKQAAYASGTGTASLVFRYLVVAADADVDGISIGASALALNGGTIKEAGGTLDAVLGLGAHAVSSSAGHKVAGGTITASSGSGMTITSSPASDSTYVLGERIEVEVTFTRPVTVTGAPQLVLIIGRSTQRRAAYVSGTGTNALTFRYTVTATDADTAGLSVAGGVGLNGGAINDARDGATAARLVGIRGIPRDKAHKVDGSRGPPGVSELSISSPVVGDTFERGDTIGVTVTFNKAVDVTGGPQLALTIGSTTKQAAYASGTGSTSLVFRYVVVTADADADGISIGASALALNDGTIKKAGGTTDALLGLGAHAVSSSAGHKVAGATITASSVSGVTITSEPASDSTYIRTERIEVEVTFTRPVTVTGVPDLWLQFQSRDRRAGYVSGTGTNALTFRHAVLAGDADEDGLSIFRHALVLDSASNDAINDARDGTTAASLLWGPTLVISNDAAHKVDGSREPQDVSGLSISSPVVGDTFERGETIEVTVTFDKAVDVTGTPQLALAIGARTRQAAYASGTGSRSLVFRYLVAQADVDADGISIGASALTLNGGTIDVAGGTTDVLLGLGEHAVSNSAGHKVAGNAFTASSVGGVTITSSPASDSTYVRTERIEVEVTFTRPVTVTGGPQLLLGIASGARRAAYVSGTGTNALTFRYTVTETDADTAGLSIGASALAVNGGAIDDARDGATAASLGLGTNAISNDAAHKVDGSREPPGVSGLSISSPVVGDTFERGETIEVTVTFDKAVDVTGTPQLALAIGARTRQAAYASGTGSRSLVFRYLVAQADVDADGISIGASALTLNGGTIDVPGGTTDVLLGLGEHAVSNSAGHKVAGNAFTASSVSGVTITSSPAGDSTYVLAERIEVEVTFTRPVTVTGGPQLLLGIASGARRAAYVSGTGTNALTFRYTVTETDADTAGLSIGASALAVNGGAIDDARDGATAASLGLGTNAISNDAAHKVDGSREPPGVSGLSISSPVVGDTFERGETIEVTMTFNKAVDVTGTPQLALAIGARTRQAAYASGTGSRSLVFRYLVAQADVDADGISIGASALTLNGGTIDVPGGTTDVLLGLGEHAVSNSAGHKVAGNAFTASSVSGVTITSSPAGDSTYVLAERIEVEVTFTRPVTVTGGPQLLLGIASGARRAAYVSGTGTNALTFRYTVTETDADTAGLSIGASALAVNGGAIDDARDGATAASLGLGTNAISNDAAHKVDGSREPPGVSGLSISSPVVGDTFERGETIEVTMTFNKAVDVTGTPQLALAIGARTRQAAYASGTGSRSLVFRYLVAQADVDADGISIGASALTLNGGTIDVAGGTTDALLGLGEHAVSNSAGHKVAGNAFTASSVSGVTITSSPAGDSTYVLAERIEVEVTFTRPVTVTGGPQLLLGIASGARRAAYVSGTGTNALTFRYTVTETDADTAGLSIGASALAVNGGAIDDARGGATAANLGLGTNAISNDAAHKVDGSRRRVRIREVRLNRPVSDSTYQLGEDIVILVEFDGNVRLADGVHPSQLSITVAMDELYPRQAAACVLGHGNFHSVLRCDYKIQKSDLDANGVSIGASALAANRGKIKERIGSLDVALDLGDHAITNDARHKVNGSLETPPSVIRLFGYVIPRSRTESTAVLGDMLHVELLWDRAVSVRGGGPQLALEIDGLTRQAAYVIGTGSRRLEFRYTVQAADVDSTGISIGANALTLNGGTIILRGSSATNANLGLDSVAVTNVAALKVDGSRRQPRPSGVVLGSPPVGDTFERGDTIVVTVTFTDSVDVTGTPLLVLGIGTATRYASYAGGTGTASLVFRYVVASGDADTDGLSIGWGSLVPNGGTIKEAGGTLHASLSLLGHAVTNSAGHKVAGGTFTASSVSGVAIASVPASDSTYAETEEIEVEVSFNRRVTVTGTPQLVLSIDTLTRQADYASGAGTATLTFAYQVVAADADSTGISIGANALTLNGGTIADARDDTTAAGLGLGSHAIADAAAHKVDGSLGPPVTRATGAPEARGVAIGAPAVGDTFERGETIEVELAFHRAVDVTGTPRLALTIGAATRQADYAPERDGHGHAGVPLRGGVGRRGRGRVEHRGERADAERRHDQGGGRDAGRAAGPGRSRRDEQRGPQGCGRDVHDAGRERGDDIEHAGEREHVPAGRVGRGEGGVRPTGGGDGFAAVGADDRHAGAAGQLRVGVEHCGHAGVRVRGPSCGRGHVGDQHRRERVDAQRRDDCRRAAGRDRGVARPGVERDRERFVAQGERQPGAAGGGGVDGGCAAGGHDVRAWRHGGCDGDVQQGGGRDRQQPQLALGIGEHHAAGELRERYGHDGAGVPVRGGADGRGRGRVEHRRERIWP